MRVELPSGVLTLEHHRGRPFVDLLDFAVRKNPKRGFLFVSKVLGKHIPCRPSVVLGAQRDLAAHLPEFPGPVLVMGLAETATALGHGLAQALAIQRPDLDVLFHHSTRHPLPRPEWFEFREEHSHAAGHLVYPPAPPLQPVYSQIRTLVLVDDEITTGRTLCALAHALASRLPRLQQVVFATLVSWLPASRATEAARELPVPLTVIALAEGQFSFAPAPSFAPATASNTLASRAPAVRPRDDLGRMGIRLRGAIAWPEFAFMEGPRLPASGRIHAIGTGEFMYAPLRWAERIESYGRDVLFHASTRSPVLPGGPIALTIACSDEFGEGVTNYLHNPPAGSHHIAVLYESASAAHSHDLPGLLTASRWALPLTAGFA